MRRLAAAPAAHANPPGVCSVRGGSAASGGSVSFLAIVPDLHSPLTSFLVPHPLSPHKSRPVHPPRHIRQLPFLLIRAHLPTPNASIVIRRHMCSGSRELRAPLYRPDNTQIAVKGRGGEKLADKIVGISVAAPRRKWRPRDRMVYL
jgi:hypothetical protein